MLTITVIQRQHDPNGTSGLGNISVDQSTCLVRFQDSSPSQSRRWQAPPDMDRKSRVGARRAQVLNLAVINDEKWSRDQVWKECRLEQTSTGQDVRGFVLPGTTGHQVWFLFSLPVPSCYRVCSEDWLSRHAPDRGPSVSAVHASW